MQPSDLPSFDFEVPRGYRWLLERRLMGFAAGTQLQPWHYLPPGQVFELRERWPQGPASERLVAFAKRQDCDDLACFEVTNSSAQRIVLVHGWTAEGYQVTQTFGSFWDWLKLVVEDIGEWVDRG